MIIDNKTDIFKTNNYLMNITFEVCIMHAKKGIFWYWIKSKP